MERARSVSPVGASRFERPLTLASVTKPVMKGTNAAKMVDSKNTSPSSPSTSSASHSQFSQQSVPSTMPSSVDYNPNLYRPVTPRADQKDVGVGSSSPTTDASDFDDPDDWLGRFRSDPDLSISISDECPDRATLAAVYDLPLFTADGTSRPFGSLYDPAYALHTRQLVLFVRHFFCGACQAYLKALAASVTKEDYFSIPIPTSIIVIGCGQPDLIPQYKKFTGCPFPIFADPSRQLFKKLGMTITLNIGGKRPDYMREISIGQWANGQFITVAKSLKDADGIRKRDVVRAGHPLQIGGEFLFEDGEVVWCHRMRNMRNHAEVEVLRKLLDLPEQSDA